MGSSSRGDNEAPAHRVFVGAFEMALTPVTNASYRRYLADTGDDAPKCRAAAERPLNEETLLVGDGGVLKNTLLFVTKIPKDNPAWIHPDYASAPTLLEGENAFDQRGCLFLSHVFAMRSNQTVQVLNSFVLGAAWAGLLEL